MLQRDIISFCLVFYLFFPSKAYGAGESVVINEVAWAGTAASAADEWVELYNASDNEIILDGWGLYEDAGETLIVSLIGKVGAYGYLLIERSDETTLLGVISSQPPEPWGGGGLSNQGEHLVLKDAAGVVVDSIDATSGWPAGDAQTRGSMERTVNEMSWQTSTNVDSSVTDAHGGDVLGTPLKENVVLADSVEPEESPDVGYSTLVRINEIFPNPVGSDDAEFIELYNDDDKEVDLTGWFIADSATTKEIGDEITLEHTVIGPGGFLVIKRTQGSVRLNNDTDEVSLLNPEAVVIDAVTYEDLAEGHSYIFHNDKWIETAEVTVGEVNVPLHDSDPDDNEEPESDEETSEEEKEEDSGDVLSVVEPEGTPPPTNVITHSPSKMIQMLTHAVRVPPSVTPIHTSIEPSVYSIDSQKTPAPPWRLLVLRYSSFVLLAVGLWWVKKETPELWQSLQ